MRPLSTLRYPVIGIFCVLTALLPAFAEDTKGKWQFGFGLSYYSTTDYIRSNSDVAVATTVAGQQGGLPTVTFVDPRPDENMLNEPSSRDNFKWDFSASYGLTRWLALEMAVGYMETAVGNIEYYLTDRSKFIGNGTPVAGAASRVCGPNGNAQCFSYPGTTGVGSSTISNDFISVGDVTTMPVQLSALVRFRPESPLDPYIGLGVGYIFTDMNTNEEFDRHAGDISSLNVTTSWGGEVDTGLGPPDPSTKTVAPPGYNPAALQAEVSDGFEYHAVGGIDYYFSEHMSMYVDARYVWSDTSIDITANGDHQVRLAAYFPGRLQSFQVGGVNNPNYWEDVGFTGCEHGPGGATCAGDDLLATEDSNGNGTLDEFVGEGTGKLYFYPMGPNPNDPTGKWTAADAVEVVDCPTCAWAEADPSSVVLNSEDRNNNRYTDRFLLWAVDVCSLADAASNPLCAPADITSLPQYIWPGGCSLSLSDPTTPRAENEGCPRPPNVQGISLTPADDTSDTHVLQGGEIKLGGFSLGVGFKFTF